MGPEAEGRARREANQLFSSGGASLQGLRLRIENSVAVTLEDLVAAFQESRRMSEDQRDPEACDIYERVCNQFTEKIGQWERVAQKHLEEVKKSHKPGMLEKVKAEMADVRKQYQVAVRLLSRLRGTLQSLSKRGAAKGTGPAISRATGKSGTGFQDIDETWLNDE
jgi:hypothetical protein